MIKIKFIFLISLVVILFGCSKNPTRNVQPTENTLPSVVYDTPQMCGDVNKDCAVNLLDILYLINYLNYGGPPPSNMKKADVNGDCKVSILDVLYLINHIYHEGPEPNCSCSESSGIFADTVLYIDTVDVATALSKVGIVLDKSFDGVVDTTLIIGDFNPDRDTIIDTLFKNNPELKAISYEAIKWAWKYSDDHYSWRVKSFNITFVPPVGCDRIRIRNNETYPWLNSADYATIPDTYLPGDTIIVGGLAPYVCSDTCFGVRGQFEYTDPRDTSLTLLPGIYLVVFKQVREGDSTSYVPCIERM